MNIEKVIAHLPKRLSPETIEGLSSALKRAQEDAESYPAKLKHGCTFGMWRVSFSRPHSIDYYGSSYDGGYYALLDDCSDPAEFADWIAHLSEKGFDVSGFMEGVLTYFSQRDRKQQRGQQVRRGKAA